MIITRWLFRFAALWTLIGVATMVVSIGWAQTLKPREREMIFARGCCNPHRYHLFRYSIDYGLEVNMTANYLESHTDIAWSPDGEKIAFRASTDTHSFIYVMDASGENRHVVHDVVLYDFFAMRWSPDGSMLAIFSQNIQNYQQEYQLTFIRLQMGDRLPVIISSGTPREIFDLYLIGWTDTGDAAILASSNSANTTIWNVDAITGEISHQFVANSSFFVPVWSPDRQYFVRTVDSSDGTSAKIDVYHADTNTLIAQIAPRSQNWYPRWSPDSRQLAFVSPDASDLGSEVYIVDFNGGNLRLMTSLLGSHMAPNPFVPEWTVDGKILITGNYYQTVFIDTIADTVFNRLPSLYEFDIRP